MTIFITTTIYLIICSYTDIRYKKINVLFSAAAGLIGILASVCSLCGFKFFYLKIFDMTINPSSFTEHTSFFTLAVSISVSIFMLLASLLTKGALGTGDCIMAAVLSCFMSSYHLISILVYGFFFSGLTALFLIIAKKYSRKDTLFFAPFLLIGNVCCFMLYTL